ncbi:MAG: type II secretion system protein GspL [Sphingomonadales bacterium]
MSALVVFESGRWVRTADGRVTGRGEAISEALPAEDGETIVAIVPARDVTVRSLPLPNLSDAQANAAARLAMAEHSLTPIEALHVAAGPADEDGNRTVVSIESVRVTERLVSLADVGLDPDRLLAAPLLLPIPEAGFVRATFDNETVLRGRDAALLDDETLTRFLLGAGAITTFDRPAMEEALVRSVDGVNADLRQGPFAKRRQWAADAARLRRFAVMALILGVLILITQIVSIMRTNLTASGIESDNQSRAAALLPPGTVVTDPALQVEARLTAVAGAGGGFTPLASAYATAVNATPNVELGSMIFDGEGGLRATVRAGSPADLDAVEARIAAAGLRATTGPIVANQGRPYRDITVTAR